ncbi:MAG: hypothetical protein PHV93_03520 [Candidatus Pacebacteria bacterium]|nr:hypothetical protein [Candidatus Paceibacterota bacterium]
MKPKRAARWRWRWQLKRWHRILLWAVAVIIIVRYGFFNYTEPTELGVSRNWLTGEMWTTQGGYQFIAPWIGVAHIDTRPVKVVVSSTGRGYSAKLVQFQPEHWREFVDTEGWRYYWWDNRFSINFGLNEECRGMESVLRGYAYSPKKYSFVKILEEY